MALFFQSVQNVSTFLFKFLTVAVTASFFANGNKKSVCCVSKLMSFTVGSYRRREGERSIMIDNDSVPFGTYHQVQLLIYLSSVFPQSSFRLHLSFAEIFSGTEVVFIVVLHTFMVQKAFF